jgi:aldose 1-epimerase
MSTKTFGTFAGREVLEIAIRSSVGAEAKILTYGAVVRDLVVPLGSGRQRVVTGLNAVEDYVEHSPHMGAIAGRYANRIRGGRFDLDGEHYQLPLNQSGRHSLHGGGDGLGRSLWQLAAAGADFVALTHLSPDGDSGYPGTLVTSCIYRLHGATLRIELSATTDKATPVNLCHHSYFNLDGAASILDHTLEIAGDVYTPTDDDLIPTGEILRVAGTPFDFRAARSIRTERSDGSGNVRYDVNFLLRRDLLQPSGIPHLPLAYAGTARSPLNGLGLAVWTTEPGLQVYDGAKVDLSVAGLDGVRYGPHAGLCLEPQHVPDSPNHPYFPNTILRPGEVYRQVTEYRFG